MLCSFVYLTVADLIFCRDTVETLFPSAPEQPFTCCGIDSNAQPFRLCFSWLDYHQYINKRIAKRTYSLFIYHVLYFFGSGFRAIKFAVATFGDRSLTGCETQQKFTRKLQATLNCESTER
ncbi:hypothetical protein RvY_04712 [Ramazzottius varieornatus]|uniref:Uncharacterized protein n=1 Tax=Ramazzottius varieornatus TaxID=947166 RepID=A0A1D1V1R2_RAMVA|nr:hypothetical protein RvY_04712 [Ramazzottius varieornatus]